MTLDKASLAIFGALMSHYLTPTLRYPRLVQTCQHTSPQLYTNRLYEYLPPTLPSNNAKCYLRNRYAHPPEYLRMLRLLP
jgi:hypothetical protein